MLLWENNVALVDRMPGLTRDRREGITEIFDLPIRLVDTAGYEHLDSIYDQETTRSMNKKMMHDMILQTRNSLVYSDLVIFMLDSTTGIHQHDITLNDWIINRKLLIDLQDAPKV